MRPLPYYFGHLYAIQTELEERSADAASAEEQVKRLTGEMSSLQDQLRREKDKTAQADKQRAGLDAQLRDMQVVVQWDSAEKLVVLHQFITRLSMRECVMSSNEIVQWFNAVKVV